MKKKSWLALILAMILILSACGNSANKGEEVEEEKEPATEEKKETTGDDKNEMTFVLSNEPDGIDPGITSNSFASVFLVNCFEGLVNYSRNNEIIPGVAESWDISEDGKTYTFHLRKGLKWSDGSDLTSEDFKYSMMRVLDPATTAQYVSFLTDYIEGAAELFQNGTGELGVECPDPDTLVIKLTKPAPYFLDMLGMWVYDPVQKATIEANGDKWTTKPETYICNGPFKITDMKLGESVTLEKNENYWDADNVKMEKITFRYIKDQSTALTAFESGKVDGIRSVPLADVPRLKQESDDYYIIPGFSETYYLINIHKKPFDDVRVRKALNLAVDRQALINNVLQSADIPASALVPQGYVAGGKDFTDGRGDFDIKDTASIEEAKQLLADAGYPNGEGFPTLELSYYSDPQVKLIVESLAQMFKDNLGINVNITTEEWAVYYENVKADKYDVAAMGWNADYLHPMSFMALFYSTDLNNLTKYSNPEYDKLIDQAQVEQDPVKAMELMREAETLMMNDYPFLPLFYRASSLMMSEKVKGWYLTTSASLMFKDAYIEQ